MVDTRAATRPQRAVAMVWRRASVCASGECVEVAQSGDDVLVRNSREVDLILRFGAKEWRTFVAGVRSGEFEDLL
jgi:hypothetical protein